eukprot:g4649.t1
MCGEGVEDDYLDHHVNLARAAARRAVGDEKKSSPHHHHVDRDAAASPGAKSSSSLFADRVAEEASQLSERASDARRQIQQAADRVAALKKQEISLQARRERLQESIASTEENMKEILGSLQKTVSSSFEDAADHEHEVEEREQEEPASFIQIREKNVARRNNNKGKGQDQERQLQQETASRQHRSRSHSSSTRTAGAGQGNQQKQARRSSAGVASQGQAAAADEVSEAGVSAFRSADGTATTPDPAAAAAAAVRDAFATQLRDEVRVNLNDVHYTLEFNATIHDDATEALVNSENAFGQFVKYHNVYRCMHGIEPLRWSNHLAEKAQKIAESDECGRFMRCGGHSGVDMRTTERYGEPLTESIAFYTYNSSAMPAPLLTSTSATAMSEVSQLGVRAKESLSLTQQKRRSLATTEDSDATTTTYTCPDNFSSHSDCRGSFSSPSLFLDASKADTNCGASPCAFHQCCIEGCLAPDSSEAYSGEDNATLRSANGSFPGGGWWSPESPLLSCDSGNGYSGSAQVRCSGTGAQLSLQGCDAVTSTTEAPTTSTTTTTTEEATTSTTTTTTPTAAGGVTTTKPDILRDLKLAVRLWYEDGVAETDGWSSISSRPADWPGDILDSASNPWKDHAAWANDGTILGKGGIDHTMISTFKELVEKLDNPDAATEAELTKARKLLDFYNVLAPTTFEVGCGVRFVETKFLAHTTTTTPASFAASSFLQKANGMATAAGSSRLTVAIVAADSPTNAAAASRLWDNYQCPVPGGAQDTLGALMKECAFAGLRDYFEDPSPGLNLQDSHLETWIDGGFVQEEPDYRAESVVAACISNPATDPGVQWTHEFLLRGIDSVSAGLIHPMISDSDDTAFPSEAKKALTDAISARCTPEMASLMSGNDVTVAAGEVLDSVKLQFRLVTDESGVVPAIPGPLRNASSVADSIADAVAESHKDILEQLQRHGYNGATSTGSTAFTSKASATRDLSVARQEMSLGELVRRKRSKDLPAPGSIPTGESSATSSIDGKIVKAEVNTTNTKNTSGEEYTVSGGPFPLPDSMSLSSESAKEAEKQLHAASRLLSPLEKQLRAEAEAAKLKQLRDDARALENDFAELEKLQTEVVSQLRQVMKTLEDAERLDLGKNDTAEVEEKPPRPPSSQNGTGNADGDGGMFVEKKSSPTSTSGRSPRHQYSKHPLTQRVAERFRSVLQRMNQERSRAKATKSKGMLMLESGVNNGSTSNSTEDQKWDSADIAPMLRATLLKADALEQELELVFNSTYGALTATEASKEAMAKNYREKLKLKLDAVIHRFSNGYDKIEELVSKKLPDDEKKAMEDVEKVNERLEAAENGGKKRDSDEPAGNRSDVNETSSLMAKTWSLETAGRELKDDAANETEVLNSTDNSSWAGDGGSDFVERAVEKAQALQADLSLVLNTAAEAADALRDAPKEDADAAKPMLEALEKAETGHQERRGDVNNIRPNGARQTVSALWRDANGKVTTLSGIKLLEERQQKVLKNQQDEDLHGSTATTATVVTTTSTSSVDSMAQVVHTPIYVIARNLPDALCAQGSTHSDGVAHSACDAYEMSIQSALVHALYTIAAIKEDLDEQNFNSATQVTCSGTHVDRTVDVDAILAALESTHDHHPLPADVVREREHQHSERASMLLLRVLRCLLPRVRHRPALSSSSAQQAVAPPIAVGAPPAPAPGVSPPPSQSGASMPQSSSVPVAPTEPPPPGPAAAATGEESTPNLLEETARHRKNVIMSSPGDYWEANNRGEVYHGGVTSSLGTVGGEDGDNPSSEERFKLQVNAHLFGTVPKVCKESFALQMAQDAAKARAHIQNMNGRSGSAEAGADSSSSPVALEDGCTALLRQIRSDIVRAFGRYNELHVSAQNLIIDDDEPTSTSSSGGDETTETESSTSSTSSSSQLVEVPGQERRPHGDVEVTRMRIKTMEGEDATAAGSLEAGPSGGSMSTRFSRTDAATLANVLQESGMSEERIQRLTGWATSTDGWNLDTDPYYKAGRGAWNTRMSEHELNTLSDSAAAAAEAGREDEDGVEDGQASSTAATSGGAPGGGQSRATSSPNALVPVGIGFTLVVNNVLDATPFRASFETPELGDAILAECWENLPSLVRMNVLVFHLDEMTLTRQGGSRGRSASNYADARTAGPAGSTGHPGSFLQLQQQEQEATSLHSVPGEDLARHQRILTEFRKAFMAPATFAERSAATSSQSTRGGAEARMRFLTKAASSSLQLVENENEAEANKEKGSTSTKRAKASAQDGSALTAFPRTFLKLSYPYGMQTRMSVASAVHEIVRHVICEHQVAGTTTQVCHEGTVQIIKGEDWPVQRLVYSDIMSSPADGTEGSGSLAVSAVSGAANAGLLPHGLAFDESSPETATLQKFKDQVTLYASLIDEMDQLFPQLSFDHTKNEHVTTLRELRDLLFQQSDIDNALAADMGDEIVDLTNFQQVQDAVQELTGKDVDINEAVFIELGRVCCSPVASELITNNTLNGDSSSALFPKFNYVVDELHKVYGCTCLAKKEVPSSLLMAGKKAINGGPVEAGGAMLQRGATAKRGTLQTAKTATSTVPVITDADQHEVFVAFIEVTALVAANATATSGHAVTDLLPGDFAYNRLEDNLPQVLLYCGGSTMTEVNQGCTIVGNWGHDYQSFYQEPLSATELALHWGTRILRGDGTHIVYDFTGQVWTPSWREVEKFDRSELKEASCESESDCPGRGVGWEAKKPRALVDPYQRKTWVFSISNWYVFGWELLVLSSLLLAWVALTKIRRRKRGPDFVAKEAGVQLEGPQGYVYEEDPENRLYGAGYYRIVDNHSISWRNPFHPNGFHGPNNRRRVCPGHCFTVFEPIGMFGCDKRQFPDFFALYFCPACTVTNYEGCTGLTILLWVFSFFTFSALWDIMILIGFLPTWMAFEVPVWCHATYGAIIAAFYKPRLFPYREVMPHPLLGAAVTVVPPKPTPKEQDPAEVVTGTGTDGDGGVAAATGDPGASAKTAES